MTIESEGSGAPPLAPQTLRDAAEETFRAAMVMFEELPEGAYEDAPFSTLALAVVGLRNALDAKPGMGQPPAGPLEQP